jgi:hypothetical protein
MKDLEYIQGPICKEGQNDCLLDEDLHSHCLDGTWNHSLIIDEQLQDDPDQIEIQVHCVICNLPETYWYRVGTERKDYDF